MGALLGGNPGIIVAPEVASIWNSKALSKARAFVTNAQLLPNADCFCMAARTVTEGDLTDVGRSNPFVSMDFAAMWPDDWYG